MERNPIAPAVLAALIPWIGSAVTVALVGIGGYWGYRNLSAAQAERELQLQQQAELNRSQAYSSQIQSQITIDRLTPLAWLTVPAMVAVGAYFLYKANREAVSE